LDKTRKTISKFDVSQGGDWKEYMVQNGEIITGIFGRTVTGVYGDNYFYEFGFYITTF
jgi:hypothetical protein